MGLRIKASDVTVVIPAFNAEKSIGRTIESVLKQTLGRPILIVSDDGSTDRTADVAREFGQDIQLICSENQGPGAARNRGIKTAVSKYIAFCDADDTWPKNRLEIDSIVFNENPQADLILGKTLFETENTELIRGLNFESYRNLATIYSFGAATVLRSLFDSVGGIDELLNNYEDYEWFMRVSDLKFSLVRHHDVSQHRFVHQASMSRNNPPTPQDMLKLLRKSVVRKTSLAYKK